MALLQISEPGESTAPHQHRLAAGIDLGTTNSLVASVRSGVAETLPDSAGHNLLPSVVHYAADASPVVGQSALAFAETAKPLVDATGRIHSWSTFERFVLIQDTGGAIRGAGRADLFWGNGPYAEIAAGHMKHPGKLFFLILKPTT